MSVLNLPIVNHASSYRQTRVVLSQRSRTVSDKGNQTIGKAPILSNYSFKLVCENFLDLLATRWSEPVFTGTELSHNAAEVDLPLP